jgi:uncharacterized protein
MNGFRGRFVWYELMTRDVEKALGFYRDVVGWNVQKMEGTGEPYSMFAAGDRTVAGVMKLPPDAPGPPHWLGYVAVPDTGETTALAEKRGAKIHVHPRDIPTIGRFSVIQDPQGAFIALFTPAPSSAGSGPSSQSAPGPRDFSWHELATTDIDLALKFYRELFGWEKKETHDMGPAGIYQIYGTADRSLGGMFRRPPEMPGRPAWLFYTLVTDIDAAVERVKRGGGKVLNGPMEVPGGDRIAQCQDPLEAAFAMQTAPAR